MQNAKVINRFTLNASQPTGLVYDPQYHELYVAVRYAVLAISADTGAEIDRVAAPAGVDQLVARSAVTHALCRERRLAGDDQREGKS